MDTKSLRALKGRKVSVRAGNMMYGPNGTVTLLSVTNGNVVLGRRVLDDVVIPIKAIDSVVAF